MAGAFSGHLLNSYDSSVVSSGHVSFDANMHGTQGNQSFSLFNESSLALNQVSEATHRKIEELKHKLNQKLGPEYVSQRPGGGGMRLTYAEGWKIINLANEVFGFNGWSTKVVSMVTDFIDSDAAGSKFNICVTATVRVTLRDGVHHEDVGCGTIENVKSKAQGLDKCKKEAVTDAVKRALRNFGNLMGNCLYDKNYTQEVVKIKVPPAKFDQGDLYRRPELRGESSTSRPTASANTSLSNPTPPPATPSGGQFQPQQPPHQQRPNVNQPQVKTEPVPSASAMGPAGRMHMMNLPSNDTKGKQPQRSMQPPPPQQPQRIASGAGGRDGSRRVSFTEERAVTVSADAESSVTLGTGSSDQDQDMDGFGFSDDDALFASVNLDDLGPPIGEDVGRPIDEDADFGRPVIPEESPLELTISHQPAKPPSSRVSRLEAIIAAQMASGSSSGQSPSNRQGQLPSLGGSNENMDPHGNQPSSHGGINEPMKSAIPAMGGFQFPPGMPNPLQTSCARAAGMKRPVDMMSSGELRGSRPGMGLHQAQQNGTTGRQVLGHLPIGGSGDPKRLRR